MMKRAIAISVILLLSGCGQPSMKNETSANGAEAQLIATVDGCRVWRLYDGLYPVYFSRCPEGAANTKTEFYQNKLKIQRYSVGLRP